MEIYSDVFKMAAVAWAFEWLMLEKLICYFGYLWVNWLCVPPFSGVYVTFCSHCKRFSGYIV